MIVYLDCLKIGTFAVKLQGCDRRRGHPNDYECAEVTNATYSLSSYIAKMELRWRQYVFVVAETILLLTSFLFELDHSKIRNHNRKGRTQSVRPYNPHAMNRTRLLPSPAR